MRKWLLLFNSHQLHHPRTPCVNREAFGRTFHFCLQILPFLPDFWANCNVTVRNEVGEMFKCADNLTLRGKQYNFIEVRVTSYSQERPPVWPPKVYRHSPGWSWKKDEKRWKRWKKDEKHSFLFFLKNPKANCICACLSHGMKDGILNCEQAEEGCCGRGVLIPLGSGNRLHVETQTSLKILPSY